MQKDEICIRPLARRGTLAAPLRPYRSRCISVPRCPAGSTERPNSLRFHCGVLGENGLLHKADAYIHGGSVSIGRQPSKTIALRVTRQQISACLAGTIADNLRSTMTVVACSQEAPRHRAGMLAALEDRNACR